VELLLLLAALALVGDQNLTLDIRLCLAHFRRRRFAFAVAGPCHGRMAAITAVAPVRPEAKILVERLIAVSFSAAMRRYSSGGQVPDIIKKLRRAMVSHDATASSAHIKGRAAAARLFLFSIIVRWLSIR
jgi:hypothetical protein